jgi:3-phosphoshikimate 1-carboxyvinyltransferase
MTHPPQIPSVLDVTGPSTLHGSPRVPGDKSISHRAVLLSALAPGTSTVRGLSRGADVLHSLTVAQALGAHVEMDDDLTESVRITGGALRHSDSVLDFGNSGTGIRLFAGIAVGLPFRCELDGDGSVRSRPMDRVTTPLRLMGATISGASDGRFAPLVVDGGELHAIEYATPVSSAQVKSAILLAGLAADGTTTVTEATPTRRHTEEMLAARGADIRIDGTTTRIRRSTLRALDEVIPGDPSQAAFWIAAAAGLPGSEVTITGLYLGTARAGFLDVLRRMGAALDVTTDAGGSGTVTVSGTQLHGTDIAPEEVPGLIDELPALAATAALASGVTRVRGASELRFKETDRLATIAEMLGGFGVKVAELGDGLDITGGTVVQGVIDSRGDHRIAMAAAMLALAARGTSRVHGFDAVATSYPTFLEHLGSCAPQARLAS